MLNALRNCTAVSLLILSMLILSAAGVFACAESTPTPASTPSVTSTPEPTSPLTEEWSADGIIKAGEYQGFNTYNDYEIYWRSDEQYVYIGLKANTNGWVAVAIQPGSKMKDADMLLGFVEDDETTVQDLFSTGNFGPHLPDTELGGMDNILESGGKEENGFTTIEFKRALDTGDDYDIPLSEGINRIIWAFGSNDNPALKHSTRGYGEIEL